VDLDRPHGRVHAEGAELRLGEGDDALSLRITAERHVVHIHATLASPALAEALAASADELRQALGAHGLELGQLSTHTGQGDGGGSAAGGDTPGPGEPGGNDAAKQPKPTRRRGVRVVA
jgi:hypothetical protein